MLLLNPDSGFGKEEVEMIVEEMWEEFVVGTDGLGMDAVRLQGIYDGGYANIHRDYDILVMHHAARPRPGVDDAGQTGHAVVVEEEGGGGDGDWQDEEENAVHQQQEEEEEESGVVAHAARPTIPGRVVDAAPEHGDPIEDVFGNVKTPYLGRVSSSRVKQEEENIMGALVFGLYLAYPGTQTKNLTPEPDVLGKHVEKALADSLPTGMQFTVHPIARTIIPGVLYGVECVYQESDVHHEEIEYFKAVLQADSSQIFPASLCGDSVQSVLPMIEIGPEQCEIAAKAMGDVLAISKLMAAPEKASFAVSLRIKTATIDYHSCPDDMLDNVLQSWKYALPERSAAQVASTYQVGDGEWIITLGSNIPVSFLQVGKMLFRNLIQDPGSVFPGIGKVSVVATQEVMQRGTIIIYDIALQQGLKKNAKKSMVRGLLQDIETLLPPGSTISVAQGDIGRDANIRYVGQLHASSTQDEYEFLVKAASNIHEWSNASKLVHSIVVTDGMSLNEGDGRRRGFGPPVPQILSPNTFTTPSRAALLASPDPHSGLIGTLDVESPIIPDHEGPLPLGDTDDEGVVINEQISPPQEALIAGYQRKSTPSSGSSGLVDAIDNLNIPSSRENQVESVEETLASTDKDEGLKMRNLISVHAFPAIEPEQNNITIQNEEAEVELDMQQNMTQNQQVSPQGKTGWMGFLKSLSPKKKKSQNPRTSISPKKRVQEAQAEKMLKRNQAREAVLNIDAATDGEKSRMLAVVDAKVKQIVSNVAANLDTSGFIPLIVLEKAFKSATKLPPWACHSACMEISDLLASKEMYAGLSVTAYLLF